MASEVKQWHLHGKGFRADHTNGGEFVPIVDSNGHWIADVRAAVGEDSYKSWAWMTAAAPELLEACEAALDDISPECTAATGMLRAAIAKAKGTT